MKTTILLIAAMLSLTGCIANLNKETPAAQNETVVPAAIADIESPTAGAATPTPETKAPVARISAFGSNGALIFKSTFTAEDPTAIVFVEEKSKITLIAGDSETLEPGATLTSFAWTLNGKPLANARQATTELAGAGLYTIALLVTDSNGKTDNQTIQLGVAPKPIEVITELLTGPVAGIESQGQPGTVNFDLTQDGAGVPATITAVTFSATPPAACDAILEVIGPDGTSLGSKDDGGFGGTEEITAGALTPGAYTINIASFACAAPDGIPITITVTYLPTVPGLGPGDEHGGH